MSELALLVENLEKGSTELASCLSSRPDLSHGDQLLLVLADQKYRVQRGEPCSAEHYANLLPWLASNTECQQQLIASEFALRLWSVPPDVLLAQFESRYQPIGEPLIGLLNEQLRKWNAQPLDTNRFDRLCDEFEKASGAGTSPSIESYLQRAPTASHQELLRELILIETYHLARAGKPTDWDDYCRRFPAYAERIRRIEKQHPRDIHPLASRSISTQPNLQVGNAKDLTGAFISSHTVGDLRNGRYRFVRKLGQGAYGSVYLAQDTDLKRQVAVKVPSREALKKLVDVESYLVEAQTVAALDHPHIVTVHDIGRTLDGSVYVVSKFIDGCSLADWIKKDTSDFEVIAKLLEPIAEALHHAHQRRLIHRDIKPANILIEEATGMPYVADFGLAIREGDYLMDGRIAGTPAYMSPEQVRGEGHRLDGRSDLFSLGMVMYQMLTGRLPFSGQTREEIAHEITSVEPPAPRSLKNDIPAELERICLKLLRKRASERYANGRELADDLRAWLTPRAIQIAKSASKKITPRGLRSFTADDADFFLDLLPGPRNRDGLPESIAFWKERIEQRDSDQTFTVGLLYGPSGCGKSSLVKAGLIPNLSSEVIAIYVEATPEETESRLLRGLCKAIPELREELTLVDALKHLRRGKFKKVVVIIDQFEQWLYAKSTYTDVELTNALRQCDGGHVQGIVMIRDDFAMAAARFMDALDVPILQGMNFATVDLFDSDHARKVLIKFGQAFEKFSTDAQERKAEQNRFLDLVVSGLAQNGKMVSVQIALFAEMVKDKPWVPSTLEEVGGTQGIGVSFLEETFSARSANPKHKVHQQAARQLLSELLPDLGSDIKGHMRSHDALLQESIYKDRPGEFRELLSILDGSLRLITPTDPEGDSNKTSSSRASLATRYYQLTHDYLVPSLREWLTRKQRETKKGRAELKLAERAAAWGVNKENKQLPTLIEWLQIRRLTESAKWKANEKSVMQQATRYHVQRMVLVTAAMVLLSCGGWFGWREASRQHEATRIAGLVETLTHAEPAQIPEIVKQLAANPQLADEYLEPHLAAEAKTPAHKRARLHARLASVARDPSLLEPLVEELLTGKVNYILPIRQLLRPSVAKLSESWKSLLHDDKADPQRRFRAALALADYVPPSDDATWTKSNRTFVAQQLVSSNAEFQPILREALWPIQDKLLSDLERIFGDSVASEAQRLSAANAMADYAANDRALLTQLLTVATPEQHAVLYPLVATVSSPETIAVLSEVASTLPPEDLGSVPRIAYGQRRANAAVTMLKLGEKEKALPVFNWTDDPEAMTQFIFRCKPRGISIDTLLDLLEITTRSAYQPQAVSPGLPTPRLTNTARYALLLAIGEYTPAEIPPSRRDALVNELAQWYANDPSSGVHGASGWLLRYLGEKEVADRVDQTPVPYSPDREWFTLAITVKPTPPTKPKPENQDEKQESEGKTQESDAENAVSAESLPQKTFFYTFIVFPRGEYWIGSVADEVDRFEKQPNREFRHRVTLTRSFAILDREITYDEMISFKPVPYGDWLLEEGTPANNPCDSIDWYDSVAFCRWLGKEMGLPESEQCYPDPDSLDKEKYPRDPEADWAPRDWPLNLGGSSFRLPTEAEWEVASRCGSRTSYGFGSEVSMLRQFGWFLENSGKRTHAGRELRPSVRGLFDMDGNLCEWTYDWFSDFADSNPADPFGAKTGAVRVFRGGSCRSGAADCRAAHRECVTPTLRNQSIGFRLALVPSDPAESESAKSGVLDASP